MKVLVINCGSSSIKYQLYRMPGQDVLAKGLVEKIGEEGSSVTHRRGNEKFKTAKSVPNHKVGLGIIFDCLTSKMMGVLQDVREICAVGHRVVHGGETYSESVRIDQDVIACIESYSDLAPLHNPPNLIGINECRDVLPGVPMVAVFDTAFHQTLPKEAFLYALPYELYEKYQVRKYGFHGTSHAYVTHRAAEILQKPESETNIINCHLGNGCSVAAIRNGHSVDTTMGLTPLAGLVMGTRCGDIDPAIIPFLSAKPGYEKISDIDQMLNKESGLLGISGLSNDMRNLTEDAQKNGPESRSQLAIDIFAYRAKFYIGAYTAILGRVDAVCFMGGIGENATYARERILAGLDNCGIILDTEKNSAAVGVEAEISAPDSQTKILVIPTNEEGWIAEQTYALCK